MSTTNTTRNGKRPISEKNVSTELDADFGNNLRIPTEVMKELKAKDLPFRFVDAPGLAKNGNMHKNGWVPYKADCTPTDAGSLQLGVSPDGFIRRGTLILATRSKAVDLQHRTLISRRNAAQRDVQAHAARQLKETAKAAGFKESIVVEGYDDEDDKN